METGYLVLKRRMVSSKFDVVFPAGRVLSYYKDEQSGAMAVIHPTMGNVSLRIEPSDVKRYLNGKNTLRHITKKK